MDTCIWCGKYIGKGKIDQYSCDVCSELLDKIKDNVKAAQKMCIAISGQCPHDYMICGQFDFGYCNLDNKVCSDFTELLV